mmetsp:Transcript_17153/g.37521  ORF Transcript_17153/g.37521 Transcript_17153/m.37521 type:complete len:97 (-) Transcript_17153:759-1049(-)
MAPNERTLIWSKQKKVFVARNCPRRMKNEQHQQRRTSSLRGKGQNAGYNGRLHPFQREIEHDNDSCSYYYEKYYETPNSHRRRQQRDDKATEKSFL